MPATEQTARDPKLLHKLFGISGVLLLLSTFWMLSEDHSRSWKEYQRTWIALENRNTAWEEASISEAVSAAKIDLGQKLLGEQLRVPAPTMISNFQAHVQEEEARQQVDAAYADLKAAAEGVSLASAINEEGELIPAAQNALDQRDELIEVMQEVIDEAKYQENRLLGERKFASANLDKVRSDLGMAVRDDKPLDPIEVEVAAQEKVVSDLNLEYQEAAKRRNQLQAALDAMLAEAAAIQKEIDDKQLELDTLAKAVEDRKSEFFSSDFPFLGKRWLEMPILDAFNSPRKIDNLWTDNLTIDYNFRRVRRFDRCTTCHQGIDKVNGYQPEHDLQVTLATPVDAPQTVEVAVEQEEVAIEQIEQIYGMLLGDISLTGTNEVTVHAVTADTPAASAEVASAGSASELLSSEQVRDMIANPYGNSQEETTEPGLQMGDRIVAIEGNEILSLGQATRLLRDSVTWGEPIELTVRRGVPHPFTSHPRMDLYLSSLSPHPMSKFGCTSCHEGQGNATEFKWVSHMPNTLNERTRWREEYGWFNNHHWIYPMYPERFAESGCLKCHHDVTELAASKRFPEAPAPKVTQGHHLILKYGCFGCHEINGYSGSERIGPDMRLEPNYSAAALALQGEPNYEAVPDDMRDLIEQVAQHPERTDARHQLVEWLERDNESEQPVLSPDAERLTGVLQDVETPGTLRKVGPSLRYASSKLDETFMYDWIENPRDFRPSTRMPRFFGLNAHLKDAEAEHAEETVVEAENVAEEEELDEVDAMHLAQTFQPIEILAISTYLLDRSQQYEFAEQAEGIDSGEEAEQIARGKKLFEVRGCLACHNHDDFPRVAEFREEGEVPPGPDLSGIGSKFSSERNEHGAKWLYSWIKDPSSYNPRTIMPDLKLDPIKHSTAQPPAGEAPAGEESAEQSETVTDPAADIVAYLMSTKKENWQAKQALQLPLAEEEAQALRDLSLEYLQGAFYVEDAKLYYEKGITRADTDLESLAGAEVEMVVEADGQLTDQQRLIYVGRKAIGKYGCYACHDIPGFENSKPIGAALADWGRKDPSKLAFEHIGEYLEHGHIEGHEAHHGEHSVGSDEIRTDQEDSGGHEHSDDPQFDYEHGGQNLDPYYHHKLEGHSREGFIYQKLREPRSYDYHKAETKGYNEWLRMPMFPFDGEEREQVITFVLGLVADPPAPEFVYQPDERELAINQGKQVLTKYNCTGCHMLSVEQWDIAYPADTFQPTPEAPTYPFMTKEFTPEQIQATLAEAANEAGFLEAHLAGLPAIDNGTALPVVEVDDDGFLYAIEEGETHNPEELYYQFQLWDAVPLDGNDYQAGSVISLPGSLVTKRHAPQGGLLTRYLLPKVIDLEKQANPNANATEAYGWLPPPLVNQGNKTQGDWLFSFLLDPQQIRPAVYLQMPKFNMSPDEARKLVNYFAARDNANFPYEYSQSQSQDYLARMQAQYAEAAEGENPEESELTRLDDAMQIVVNKNYCVTCHLVGEYAPAGSDRAKAPNLAEVYKRLRYDYVFPWIANPKRILPYTSMPVNVPYQPDAENLGGIPQDIYHGTSIDQVRALSDLLLNYDKYTKAKTQIDPLVQAAKEADTAATDEAAGDSAAASPDVTAQPPGGESAAPPEAASAAPAEANDSAPNDTNGNN